MPKQQHHCTAEQIEGSNTAIPTKLLVLFAVQERDSVLAIVASVLHLGNIGFQQGDMDNAELLDEKSEDAMYTVSDLMQVGGLFAWLCSIPLGCILDEGRGDRRVGGGWRYLLLICC